MNKLLMATDLSARSDRALERAVWLADNDAAELTIVHVIDEDLPVSIADAQEKAARKAIRDQANRLTDGNAAKITIEVVFGKAYVAILKMAETMGAELIVLGTHREHELIDMFRGTTVERIIRAGRVPVLLARQRVNGPYRRIMVGVDFSPCSRRAVEFAVKFVPNGEFHLVHAYDVPFKGFLYSPGTEREVSKQHQIQFQQMVDDEMATFLAGLGTKAPKLRLVMQEGMALEIIHEQLGRLEPNLLVIGTHGRTGIAHAFLGSVAEDLLRHAPCDVVAVKA